MALTVEVIEIGDSLGIVLPNDAIEKLQVKEGDIVYLTVDSGCILLTRNPSPPAKVKAE